MTRFVDLIQGNLSTLWRAGVPSFDADGVRIAGALEDLDANYECKIAVTTAVPPIERAVTRKSADNLRFLAQLTPAEADTIGAGRHVVAIQVTNSSLSPNLVLEEHIDIEVTDDLIA